MIKFYRTEVVGWEHAIRGMRNPLNSWEKSDSVFTGDDGDGYTITGDTFPTTNESPEGMVGPNDLYLMKKLRNAGTDHRKFMRMITVYVDIIAPLYWWKEFDTYKVGTVANSCSTMHKIADKEFTLDDFSHEHLIWDLGDADKRDGILMPCTPMQHLQQTIASLNLSRNKFIETNDKKYWYQMIQLLPSSYNQKRTVMLNYEVLANIYESRKNHKLDEWADHDLKTGNESIGNPKQCYFGFCDWINTLPYPELITGEFED